jgi:spermidine synthase
LESVGFTVRPYQTSVPSFGIWGYALAKLEPFDPPQRLPAGLDLRYLNDESFAAMFDFPSDESRPNEPIEINRLDNQALVRYYEAEWKRFEQ